MFLGIDRLDYTKGIYARLRAFSELIADGDFSVEDAVFVQVATPSRERVDQYRILRDDIDRLVGRINGDLGRIGRPAISYLHSSFPREEMAALYRAADIMVVTPFRDGMNLVAKEYVACRFDDDGALVLSEFAGAADELRQAYLVNPYDINGMKAEMLEAYRAEPKDLHPADAGDAQDGRRERRRPLGLDASSTSSPARSRPTPRRTRPARQVLSGQVTARWSGATSWRLGFSPSPSSIERVSARVPPGAISSVISWRELGAERAPALLVAVDRAQRAGLVVAAEDVDVVGGDQAGWATPTASVTLTSSLRKVRMYCAHRSAFDAGSRPRDSQGSGWRRRSGSGRCGTSATGCSRSTSSPRGRR